jgi:plastocyanin
MRRLGLLLPLALAAALAVPAAADETAVTVASFRFSPETASIHQGDSVKWNWTGPDRNHTVTADDGSFESHPGVPTAAVTDGPSGETFSHTFMQTGAFTYHCRVHSYMHGTVRVLAPGEPLTDTTPPSTTLRILSSSPSRVANSGRLKIKLTVDEAATEKLTAKLGRRTIGKKTVELSDAGSKTVSLRLTRHGRDLLEGRDRARVKVIAKATDAAGNKDTQTKSKTLGSSSSGGGPY